MRCQQIFVTINILMDHTASGAMIPQIGTASKAELATPAAFGSSGVVYPLSNQAHYQKLEDAAQMRAQVQREYGIQKNRKMQEATGYAPPGTESYQVIPNSIDPNPNGSTNGLSTTNKQVIGVAVGVAALLAIIWGGICFWKDSLSEREGGGNAEDSGSKVAKAGPGSKGGACMGGLCKK